MLYITNTVNEAGMIQLLKVINTVHAGNPKLW